MIEEDELLDLVNDEDEVIGTIMRSDYDKMVGQKLGYFRASDAFLINSQGQIWIPRRQPFKQIAPGGLDFSMGEHVQSGENYATACIRGFKEELNLDVPESKLEAITKFRPKPDMPAYFSMLYVYRTDTVPPYNKEDFSEAQWYTPAELIKILEKGEPAKKSLLPAVKFINSTWP